VTTEWAYHSATQLLDAMNKGELTSRELVEYYQQRLAKVNPDINAVVATNFDAALSRADEADQARKDGISWGPLHGLPMTIKDTFEVVGMPCTAGAPALKAHTPKKNAHAVEQLLDAGAIIFGKTNTPLYASDIQSYNKIYGTTNNPWNLTLTPGGSSGGAAAALASGMTPIELGSDIGGSIRTPSHFCGVYGHKVTYGIISCRGHIPGPPGMLSEPDLSVAGPMARSADDLKMMLDIISGPTPLMTDAWQLNLPEPKQKNLSDFKVLMWLDDPLCPIDDELRPAYLKLKSHLEAQGVQVTLGEPDGLTLNSFFPTYMSLLGAVLGSSLKGKQRIATKVFGTLAKYFGKYIGASASGEDFLLGMVQPHADWIRSNEKRHHLAQAFGKLYEKYDVILTPVTMTAAFEHQQVGPVHLRKLDVNGEQRNYSDMFMWIAPATLLGLPATSAPVGQTSGGLPVNIQIIGNVYEDKTTLHFASLLEKSMGGFKNPPKYNV